MNRPAYRSGIATRLGGAFVGVSMMSMLAAIVGIASYEVIEDAQDEALDRALPTARAADQLAMQVMALVAATPAVVSADENAHLRREAAGIRSIDESFRQTAARLRDLGAADDRLRLIEAAFQSVSANLERSIDLVGERNRSTVQRSLVATQTKAEINRLIAMLDTGSTDDRSAERQAGLRLLAGNVIRHIDALVLSNSQNGVADIGRRLNNDLRSLANSAGALDRPELRDPLVQALKGLSAEAPGPASLVQAQSRLIEIDARLDQLGRENRDRAERLQADAALLVSEAGLLVDTASADARSAVAQARITLASIATLAFAAAVFIGWRYVLKDVARRISNLSRETRDLAQGNAEARVTVSGSDELGEMADAVRVFKANAAALRQSNAELEQFAYVASHDLKAPLRSIANLASWIEQDLEGTLAGETRQHMALLHGRINRMGRLLDDLLQYSKVGRNRAEVSVLDLDAVLPELFGVAAEAERFELQLASPLPRFVTAREPLEQIFLNLFSNAAKHHDAPLGNVEVAVRDLGSVFEFSVSDDGPGIPKDLQNKIFMMFQVLKSRDDVEGNGMGLAIVKKTLEAAGCTITVESDPETMRGTRFRFTWPKQWPEAGSGQWAA